MTDFERTGKISCSNIDELIHGKSIDDKGLASAQQLVIVIQVYSRGLLKNCP